MITENDILGTTWYPLLREEFEKPYMDKLASFVAMERASSSPIYPPEELVFNAFQKTPYEAVKVVIIGQDPYHGAGQAHGLAFSVPKGVPMPPSLKNIVKELVSDVGIKAPTHGCLLSWAEQGVFLLNATLTVRESDPLSHHNRGWEIFTDAVVAKLSLRQEPIVFLLWGNSAQKKGAHIHERHTVLKAPHPSPLSAYQGFFGCRHFSKVNEICEIKWDII